MTKDKKTDQNPGNEVEVVETVEVKNKEEEYLEMLQRLQAEFSNFQKRTEKEKIETVINANANLIAQLLPVLDNFELSLKHHEDQGVRMIYEDLFKILEKQGLKNINTEGKFNPEFHEALMQEEGEEAGLILEEFQKGYLFNNKLLRAAKVKISKLKAETN